MVNPAVFYSGLSAGVSWCEIWLLVIAITKCSDLMSGVARKPAPSSLGLSMCCDKDTTVCSEYSGIPPLCLLKMCH